MHPPSSLLFCHDNDDDDRVDPHAIGSAEARRPPLGEGSAAETPGDLRIKINTDRTSSPNYNNNNNNHHQQVCTTATTNTNQQTAAIRNQVWSHQEILTSEVVVGLVSSSTATTSTTTSAVAKEHLVSRGLLNIKLSTPLSLENLSIILRPRSLWSWSRSHHIEEALKRRERSFFLFLLNFCLICSFFFNVNIQYTLSLLAISCQMNDQ